MKRICTLIFFVIGLAFNSPAQYTRHIVEFRDKNGTQFSIGAPSAYLSAKAIARRISQKITIDSTDLPISKTYLDSIVNIPNVAILNQSKWLNQILIRTADTNALNKINSFPFVKSITAIAPIPKPSDDVISKKKEDVFDLGNEMLSATNRANKMGGLQDLQYGSTFNQIHLHEGEYLHNLGFTGGGITIAILDAGFLNYKTNPAFDSVRLQGRILGEWDYVMNEQGVNEDHVHGAYCLSIIAANRPGTLVGSAPQASFWLLRTEDAASEYPVEEQNWAAAAEFADSAGADMISTSLGYNIFDNSVYNHSYAQRDGNTTIITRAADLAAHKGMIVTVSAGNDGNRTDDYKFVSCPADADSVLTVGAVNTSGVIASFSCWGPNGAGKLKPNVVSVGQGTIIANTAGNPVSGNGTSFSNPNMAGLVACLWEAFPEFTNMDIIDAVQKSGDRYLSPDFHYGYGIPNFRIAYNALLNERAKRKYAPILTKDWITAYPVPSHGPFNLVFKAPADARASLKLMDARGRIIESITIDVTTGQYYQVNFRHNFSLAKGVYFVRYDDGRNKKTLKLIRD